VKCAPYLRPEMPNVILTNFSELVVCDACVPFGLGYFLNPNILPALYAPVSDLGQFEEGQSLFLFTVRSKSLLK